MPKIIKVENSIKKKEPEQVKKESEVSLDAQARLAEILNDSPRIVSLNGTEWEVRALRMGTQFLVAQEAIKVAKNESAGYSDILKQFSNNIPAIAKVLTLVLLNDKKKIYRDGDESLGFSDLFNATYDTILWDCNVSSFGQILLDVLQMIDVSFFLESCRILEMFRESTMTRKKTLGQK
jgi:hypothetical protein